MIFPKQFLDFIQTLYSEWYKVMNTCPKNSFWKGVLGKDDPSSSGSIAYGKTIPVKKQNCKLSQYADDTNINLSNFEDIDKCLKCQKATGCTLNASKINSSLI